MPMDFSASPKVVGATQVKRAIEGGRAAQVFLASDADPRVTKPIAILCGKWNLPIVRNSSMKELGKACGISVGAAVAALLKE